MATDSELVDAYLAANTMLIETIVGTLLQIDRTPLDDRATNQIASFLVAYGNEVSLRLPSLAQEISLRSLEYIGQELDEARS